MVDLGQVLHIILDMDDEYPCGIFHRVFPGLRVISQCNCKYLHNIKYYIHTYIKRALLQFCIFKCTTIFIKLYFIIQYSRVVITAVSIGLLFRVGRQQAESIVNKEHQGEQWYNCLIREGDQVQEFTGAPQGIAVKVSYPAVQMPRKLRTQSDCCNERYGLVDWEHLMKVKLYLKRHGG